MGYIDPLEAFRLRLERRIRRVVDYRNIHPSASINEIAQATRYLPSSIRLWLGKNDEDLAWKVERKKQLREKIYGR